MFARIAILAPLLLGACSSVASPPAAAPNVAAAVADHRAACAGKDGWSDPAPPLHIFANAYDVGTCGITVLLLTSPTGHVLIDGATAAAVPGILGNIRRLGFDPREVRLIVSSHPHIDHVGGTAALQVATGAEVRASVEAAAILRSGSVASSDPQRGTILGFAPVRIAATFDDGETLSSGTPAITAHLTNGHSPGGTSWTWFACERGVCGNMVYADSLTATSADSYRFRDHNERVAALRRSFQTIAALPCDVLITPHPGASHLFERLYGDQPLGDGAGCRTLASAAAERLDQRLAKEAAQ